MSGSLFDAVRRGDEAEVRRLLEVGADANELGPEQRTPLIEAAGQGRTALVQLLLAHGAEPSWKDSLEETALLKAAAHGHRDTYETLWPLAREEERDLARAFLSASGLRWDVPPRAPPPDPREPEKTSRMGRAVATAAARVSKLFGDEVHADRLDRLERAEDLSSKKRR